MLTPTAYGLSSKDSNAWKSSNPHSGCYEAETARTLDTNGGDATCNQGGTLVVSKAKAAAEVYENHGQDTRFRPSGDIGQTVCAKYGTGGGNQPLVVTENPAYAIGRDCVTAWEEVAQTLTNSDLPGAVAQPYTIGNGQVHDLSLDEKARTLNCMHDAQAAIVPQGSGEYPYIVRRFIPLECGRLQGYPDDWVDGIATPEPTEEEISWWMEAFETHRKAVKPETKPKTKNQVKKWLKNPHSDSAEYKMWGNSLAIPNAYQVLAGIAEQLQAGIQRIPAFAKKRKTERQMTIWDIWGIESEETMDIREVREEQETAVFVCLVESFTTPGPHIPDCLSVKEMAGFAACTKSPVYGMTEQEIRNTCRRLKRKGLICHAWQKENPDKPSGEYGEVWDDSPFIPRHGYGIAKAGWDTQLAQETEKRVNDEFTQYWNSRLQEG